MLFNRSDLRIITTGFSASLTWRTDMIFYRIYDIAEPVAYMVLWGALYASNDMLVGYTRQEMLTYILLSRLFDIIAVSWMHEEVAAAIREGRMTQFLLKPVSHARYAFMFSLGSSLQSKIFSILISAGLIAIFHSQLLLASPGRIFLALGVALGALIINTLLSIAYGYAAFWLGSVSGFVQSFYIVRWVFNGHSFPLDILGNTFRVFATLLPFAFSAFIPAQIYLGRMSTEQIIQSVIVELLWIGVMLLVTRFMWRLGTRAYEGVGI